MTKNTNYSTTIAVLPIGSEWFWTFNPIIINLSVNITLNMDATVYRDIIKTGIGTKFFLFYFF